MQTLTEAESSRAAPRGGRLPNLVIIGGMKCGTTSLHRYLEQHPQVFMSKKKELKFFVDNKNVGTWKLGLDWYRAHFADAGDAQVVGESTPEYAKCTVFRGVPERMVRVIPDARLLYILRDPIERMISQWVHLYASGREGRPLARALGAGGHNQYLEASRYAMQAKRYLEYFPRKSLYLTTMEELKEEPQGTLRGIFEFLGVDAEFFVPAFKKVHHSSKKKRRRSRLDRAMARMVPESLLARLRATPGLAPLLTRPVPKPELPAGVRADLEARLRDDVAELREIAGRDFPGWSVG